jgi:ketohexokinase
VSHIICIGVATLDVILEVERYPQEDAEIRALDRRIARGGNAANTAVVLAQLGHRCALVVTLGDDASAASIEADLQAHGVDMRDCRRIEGGHSPTSYILASRASGSRSIVHHRRLPEYTAQDFAEIDLGGCDWAHFEGRNVAATRRMLERLRRERPELLVSLEIEKPREGIEALWPLADLLLFSRAYAMGLGHSDPGAFLRGLQAPRDALRICSWGADGALGLDREGRLHRSPAFPPSAIVDSVGAGDSFNAGVIDALLRGADLPEVLEAGCRLAGRKLGRQGFSGLGPE